MKNSYPAEPLASRMRPRTLDDFVGQEHLVGKGKILRSLIEQDAVTSMILWGPPGVGKTTLANIIAQMTKSEFVSFSAVGGGVKEARAIMNRAEAQMQYGIKTVLFVDEIHRFNKAQQDAFLPYVEKGAITLIGATTENPSFEVNSALLSRCRVFVLRAIGKEDMIALINRAIKSERGFGDYKVEIGEDEIGLIAEASGGDARGALNILETAVLNGDEEEGRVRVTKENIEQCIGKKAFLYDKNGDGHYDMISALHKSMRNSDPDAAVYWLARMLEAGEDPLYVARRVVRFASEDVGMADNNGLLIANAAFQACHELGMPECNVALTQAVLYLSLAPKSNSAEVAYLAAAEEARRTLNEPVPLQIRNAPTSLMKDLGYGKGYIYAHDTKEKMAKMTCLPSGLKNSEFYHPTDQGSEARFKERFEAIKNWKKGK